MRSPLLPLWMLAIIAGIALPLHPAAAQDDEDEKEAEAVYILNPFSVSAAPGIGYLSVTPGGAQDTNYFRTLFEKGVMPDPKAFTAEGLFSEHDLPVGGNTQCDKIICVTGEAVEASILALPEAACLAQLGFSTNIEAAKFERAPLTLVAVVDKSGSMDGGKIATVKDSLLEILDHMGARDQLGIVLFDSRSLIYMPVTPTTKGNLDRIRTAIHEIQVGDSTNINAGLKDGFRMARGAKEDFEGVTRVMVFTDERPNTGDTSTEGFMRIARDGSEDGIGLTTIGVGMDFGAQVAQQVSSVRGGNLYYFPDFSTMRASFRENFDMMVTEMAYNMVIRISPARGMQIAGVYGLPGDLLDWEGDSLVMEIETLFLSKNAGAIYVAVKAEDDTVSLKPGMAVATASLSYSVPNAEEPLMSEVALKLVPAKKAGLGLQRGVLLVNEYASIQKALRDLYNKKSATAAYNEIEALAALFAESADETLDRERELIKGLRTQLAYQSGHTDTFAADAPQALRDLAGTWELRESSLGGKDADKLSGWEYWFDEADAFVVRVLPIGYAQFYDERGRELLGDIELKFKDNKLIFDKDGDEVLISIKRDGNTVVLKDGKSLTLKLKESKVKIRPHNDPDSVDRDPVTGLPE